MSAAVLALVTGLSVVLAVIMCAVAWRISRAERRRAEARIAALAAEIHDERSLASVAASGGKRVEIGIRGEPPRRFPAPASTGPRSFLQDLPLREATSPTSPQPGGELFVGARPDPQGTRIVTAAALGVFVIGAVAALAIVLGGARPTAPASTSSRGADPSAASAVAAPLELVGLAHERDGNRLTVSGVVHNPDSGAAIEGLEAVVVVFDREGGLMTTVRAPLARLPLAPGGESPFFVAVPNAADVGRYRVSFRVGDRVMAHVDRRSRADVAVR
jgi:hypothetical protein